MNALLSLRPGEVLGRQIERETGDLLLISPVKHIPAGEYVEEIQQ